MRYITVLLLLSMCCVGCNQTNYDSSGETNQNQGLLHTGDVDAKRDDHILIEARNTLNTGREMETISPQQAEDLTRKKLDLEDNHSVDIRYHHKERGLYMIHVFENGENASQKTGWYTVDPRTKELKKAEEKPGEGI
ncbi:hypothetical protein GJU40_16615 [Bacillus lacus]|uniref:Uncharacterized protein n=1 Tax=Metabacillus lacus TaxID=1983721 RepID=A0A7X2J1T3_9BACI|nr:hypothetical protein [Metabacillus lacus]MRX73766.1 hypothetical protein [Metabacillus lacus]